MKTGSIGAGGEQGGSMEAWEHGGGIGAWEEGGCRGIWGVPAPPPLYCVIGLHLLLHLYGPRTHLLLQDHATATHPLLVVESHATAMLLPCSPWVMLLPPTHLLPATAGRVPQAMLLPPTHLLPATAGRVPQCGGPLHHPLPQAGHTGQGGPGGKQGGRWRLQGGGWGGAPLRSAGSRPLGFRSRVVFACGVCRV